MNNRSRPYGLVLAAALLIVAPIGVCAQAIPLVPPPPPPPPGQPGAPPIITAPAQAGPVAPDGAPPAPTPPVPTPDAPNPPTPAAPSGVTLRYKFTPGQTLRYRVTMDAAGKVTMASGTGMPIKQHLVMTLHQTVKSVRASDGAATLATQVDTLTLNVNGRDIQLPAQAQDKFKQVITTTMTPAGKIVDFKAPTGAAPIPGMNFNPMDFQNLRALPDGTVDKGATWNSKYAAPMGLLTASAKYTLDDLSGDNSTATIGQKLWAEIKSPKPKAGTPAGGKVAGLITGTGKEEFDVDAGAVNSQTNALTLKMTITPPTSARPGTPASVKADFTINTDLEIMKASSTAGTMAAPAAPADEPPAGQLQ